MPRIFPMIGEAWDFCRRQQAILHVGFWFLFLPTLVSGLLIEAEERELPMLQENPELQILMGLAYLALTLVSIWGIVCVLHIGKRLMQAKSGRTRTSFRSVRLQAGPHFIPYLLTTILMSIFTILWSLLLIIPGIVYAVRVIFYPVIVVCEGEGYRKALNKSKNVVKGQFWQVLGTVLLLSLCTVVVAEILSVIFMMMAYDAPPLIVLAAYVASSIVTSAAGILYTLSLIQAYAYFKPASHSKN